MIQRVKKLFASRSGTRPGAQNERGPHDVVVATCALLFEMANIDGEFSKAERERIISLLKKTYNLSDENAQALIEASHEELEQSIDLWQFTNLINESYSFEEKTRIVEMMWQIIYTDGTLDMHEDYLVHKLAKLLRLTHGELIDAKLKILNGR
jgi:uncharacterized tellurite resistance protein B-like protein